MAYQLVLFCKQNFVKGVTAYAILLVFLEPTFVAQTTNLNNDMLLVFFTLLSLNSLVKSKSFLFTLALTGMLFTNLRGIYLLIAIIIIHIIYSRLKLIESKKSLYIGYLISITCFAIFCFFQNNELGWFIISENKNFSAHRESAGFKQALINIIVFAKGLLEFGRFIVYIFLLPLLIKYLKSKTKKNIKISRVIVAYFVFLFVLFVGIIPFSNPFGDRYLMICYLLSIILLINLLNYFRIKQRKKVIIYVTIFLCFISGHFWIYPPTLSQPWDSSLAYLNYYKVEDEMETYIDSSNIKAHDIGTRIRLNWRAESELKPIAKNKLYANFDINNNDFILLSNIENTTKDDEYNYIVNNWKLIKSYSQLGVFISLYKKP